MTALTNREIASLVWLSILVAWAARQPNVRASLVDIGKRLLDGRIFFVLVAFGAYIVLWVQFARRIGIWDGSLREETALWWILSGLPLLFQFDQAGRGEGFVRRTALAVLGVSALFEFYFSIVSFGLPIEFILVPVVTVITLGAVVVDTKQQYASQRRVWHGLLLLLLAIVFAATTHEIYAQREVLDLAHVGWATRLALLFGLNWHLREVYAFAGYWPKQVASAPTFRLALEKVREFRRHHRQQTAERRQAVARLGRVCKPCDALRFIRWRRAS